MSRGSLRLRLLLTAAISIAGALVVAAWAIIYIYQLNIDPDLKLDFSASLDRLTARIVPDQPLSEFDEEVLSDPRYTVPRGGLYWQVTDVASGETARSRSLWDEVLVIPPDPPDDLISIAGPGGPVVAVAREVQLAGAADHVGSPGTELEFAL